jgi:hypothetical protein
MPQIADMAWTAPNQASRTICFGPASGDGETVRLACDATGTRLAIVVPWLPRGTAADASPFATRLRAFLGCTASDLGGMETPLGDGGARVEALLPDPAAFFATTAGRGRLVAVSYTGRTRGPALADDMVRAFRQACPAVAG